MKTAPCPKCGSTRSDKNALGSCTSLQHCDTRRITRRIEEDKKRGGKQCSGAYGQGSIRFCLMRENHEGLHANGGIEWSDRDEAPAVRQFARAFIGRLA